MSSIRLISGVTRLKPAPYCLSRVCDSIKIRTLPSGAVNPQPNMLQLKLLEANSIRRLIKYQFLNIDAKSGTSYKVGFGQYCFCDLIESLGLGRRESIVLLAKIATPFDSDWTFLFAEASFPLYDIYIFV